MENKRDLVSNFFFYFFVTSFALGIVFRFLFNLGTSFIFFLFFISITLFFLNKKNVLICALIIIFGLGLIRTEISLIREYFLESEVGRSISVLGEVALEPSVTENSLRFVLKSKNKKEKILVITEKTSIIKYGQNVSVTGVVRLPENFTTDTDREFDYINYLSKDGVYYEMLFPKIEVLEEGGFSAKKPLFSLKNYLINKINNVIPSPESEYLGGLLFGKKESLGKDLERDFRRTGLIHVVVLSGYNVTIIAETIFRALSFLPMHISSSLGIISIISFAIMTGASATIIRASIMAIIAVFGRLYSRRFSVVRALFIAVFFMILHNPKIILYDPSFQLSFTATVGLIYLSPIISKRLHFISDRFQIRTLLSSTLATQLFVLPALLYMIGEISLIAPVTNILVLPLVPLSMLFGFITSIMGVISLTLSFLPSIPSYLLLFLQIKVVQLFSGISFASIKIESFPMWAVFVLYIVSIIYLIKANGEMESKK